MRYKVTAWHGESGSIFYVVDSQAPEQDQPAILFSYRNRHTAAGHAAALNILEA